MEASRETGGEKTSWLQDKLYTAMLDVLLHVIPQYRSCKPSLIYSTKCDGQQHIGYVSFKGP
jgi:hypothetical protein